MNYQSPAAPYAADSLDVHDKGLIFAREFGTNVGADPGDTFNTAAGTSPAIWRRCPRTGVLEIQVNEFVGPGFAGSTLPRGQSFLIPDWMAPTAPQFLPDIPEAAGTHAINIVAHIRMPTVSQDAPNDYLATTPYPAAGFIVGQENLIGDIEDTAFALFETRGNYLSQLNPTLLPPYSAPPPWDLAAFSVWAPDPPYFRQSEWEQNPAPPGPPLESPGAASALGWGADIYIRLLCIWTEKDPEGVEILPFVSNNGLAWTPMRGTEVEGLLRRVGICVRGVALGQLDWVRVYQLSIPGTEQAIGDDLGTLGVWDLSKTGARLFVP